MSEFTNERPDEVQQEEAPRAPYPEAGWRRRPHLSKCKLCEVQVGSGGGGMKGNGGRGDPLGFCPVGYVRRGITVEKFEVQLSTQLSDTRAAQRSAAPR